jgi:hypothetical protein
VRTPGDIEVVHWPVTTAGGGELAVVDALARLQRAARRFGCALRLRGGEDALLGLIDLVGLRNVLTGPAPSACECAREAEDLEQLRVEEVVVPDDPLA